MNGNYYYSDSQSIIEVFQIKSFGREFNDSLEKTLKQHFKYCTNYYPKKTVQYLQLLFPETSDNTLIFNTLRVFGQILTKKYRMNSLHSLYKYMEFLFIQQIIRVLKKFTGRYLLVEAPPGRGNHDDFVDSLALALWALKNDESFEAGVESFSWN